jgi:hypothetical protein
MVTTWCTGNCRCCCRDGPEMALPTDRHSMQLLIREARYYQLTGLTELLDREARYMRQRADQVSAAPCDH